MARDVIIHRQSKFHFAHRLVDDPGPCSNVHGHEAIVTVKLKGPVATNGMLVPLDALKQMINTAFVGPWDHMLVLRYNDPLVEDLAQKVLLGNAGWEALFEEIKATINSRGYFDNRVKTIHPFKQTQNVILIAEAPTSENIAYLIHRLLSPQLYRYNVRALSVNFQETSTFGAEFAGETRENPDYPQVG